MPQGILLKSKSAGNLNLVMRYMEMRHEAKDFTQEESAIVKGDKKLQEALEEHKLLDAKKDMDDINKKGHEAAINVHKLVINDFVSIGVLQNISREVIIRVIDLIRRVRSRKTRMPKEDLEELETIKKRVAKDERKHIFKFTAAARKIVDGLVKRCDGREDMAFLLKKHFYLDMRIVNYLKLKVEARHERRDLQEIKKTFEHISDEVERIEKGKVKEDKKLIKDFSKFHTAIIKGIEDAFILFRNSTLLFDRIIGIIRNEADKDDELVKLHQIPLMMGQQDEKVKESLLALFKNSLRDINVARLQVEKAKMAA